MGECGRASEEGKAVSVLIKGMEMPKNCNDCPLNYDSIDCMVADIALREKGCGDFLFEHERSSKCPLVPVPPHGRLIDADEFLERAIGTKCFRGDYALMLEELVGESTTIIPAETPKEEWIFADLDTIIDCYSDPASEEGEDD